MKLIFDLTKTQPIGDSKFHGGGKYGEIVFKALVERSGDILAYYSKSKWINPEIISICQKRGVTLLEEGKNSLSEFAKIYDAFIYSPIIDKEIESFSHDVIYVATLHGLRTLEMPSDNYRGALKNLKWGWLYNIYYRLKQSYDFQHELKMYDRLFSRANIRLLTVSEHSKASILSYFPKLRHEDVRVFYSPSTFKQRKYSLEGFATKPEKYYFLVSGNRWVKNTVRAVKAFDELFKERPALRGKVVIAGVKNRRYFDKYITNRDRFEFLSYVDEGQLVDLYKNAYLFVYPSLNEGFGYPPLEAMAEGTPVIASAIASIPEICSNAVSYFNPYLVSEIKMRILQMEDDSYRDRYIQESKVQFDRIKSKQDRDLNELVNYLLSF